MLVSKKLGIFLYSIFSLMLLMDVNCIVPDKLWNELFIGNESIIFKEKIECIKNRLTDDQFVSICNQIDASLQIEEILDQNESINYFLLGAGTVLLVVGLVCLVVKLRNQPSEIFEDNRFREHNHSLCCNKVVIEQQEGASHIHSASCNYYNFLDAKKNENSHQREVVLSNDFSNLSQKNSGIRSLPGCSNCHCGVGFCGIPSNSLQDIDTNFNEDTVNYCMPCSSSMILLK